MATTNSARLILTTPSDREIVMTRVFNAPRRLVWAAWTKPEYVPRWFGAVGWTVPVCEIDLRPGGTYRYVMRSADGQEVTMRGVYREVVPPQRLVSTEVFEGFSEVGYRPEDDTVSTAVLTERDGKTTWTATIVYPSKEIRDGALATPMEDGMNGSFDRLDAVLATMA